MSDADRDALEKPFDENELEYCFKHLPRNKTPGLDGLPFEVYKKILPIIKEDYLCFQNCIKERERLTGEMRKSVTRLVSKIKDGVPTVQQVRPLSMQISCAGKSSIKDFSAILSHPQPSLETSQVQNHWIIHHFPPREEHHSI